jgi:TPR repeat protein
MKSRPGCSLLVCVPVLVFFAGRMHSPASEIWKASEKELRAAAKDSLPAAVELAMRQLDGRVAPLEKEFVFKTFQRGSEADIPLAHTGLALCYLGGVGVEYNEKPVLDLLERAAAKEEPRAMFRLGVIVSRMERNEGGPGRGLELIRKSAQKGNPNALAELARYQLVGVHNDPDEAGGLNELRKLAEEKKNADAAYLLGQYHRGEGKKNPELAKKYLRMAAEKNHPGAMVALGDMAMGNGGWEGNKQARKEGSEWYRRAVAWNSGSGMRKLGMMQMRDTAVRKPGENWYQLLLEADKVGDGEATLQLAKIHYHAPGYVFRDLDWSKSAYYHEKFIRDGRGSTDFHVSLHALFELYYKGGLGLDRNYDKCLELAAEYMDQCHMAPRYAGLILLRPDAPKGNTREHFIRGYACMLRYQRMEGKTDEHTLFLLRSRHGMTKEEVARATELFRDGFPNSRTPLLP